MNCLVGAYPGASNTISLITGVERRQRHVGGCPGKSQPTEGYVRLMLFEMNFVKISVK